VTTDSGDDIADRSSTICKSPDEGSGWTYRYGHAGIRVGQQAPAIRPILADCERVGEWPLWQRQRRHGGPSVGGKAGVPSRLSALRLHIPCCDGGPPMSESVRKRPGLAFAASRRGRRGCNWSQSAEHLSVKPINRCRSTFRVAWAQPPAGLGRTFCSSWPRSCSWAFESARVETRRSPAVMSLPGLSLEFSVFYDSRFALSRGKSGEGQTGVAAEGCQWSAGEISFRGRVSVDLAAVIG